MSVALENQRYGRNKVTLVNKTYIESGEYKRKFDNISENKAVNKTLYDCAKAALKHSNIAFQFLICNFTEELCQRHDVFLTVAQRRDGYPEVMQAV